MNYTIIQLKHTPSKSAHCSFVKQQSIDKPETYDTKILANKRKEKELKNDILEIIYNNLRTENKLKSGILSPRYVTPFTIEGNYEGATFTKTGKKFKTSDEEYTGKGVLKYKGKGNTTHELHISEGFIPRGWLQTPSHTDQPSTLTQQASKNIIKTYREDLIEEIQGNLKRLGRAIRSLS